MPGIEACHGAKRVRTFAAGETKPTNLLARIEDDEKRKALDELIQKAKRFLDSGRHVGPVLRKLQPAAI
jgi:hypothetical protein